MAFSATKLVGASSSHDAKTPRLFMYGTTADALATTAAANYFVDPRLKAGDIVCVTASDGAALYEITAHSYSAGTSTSAEMSSGGNSGRQVVTGLLADVSTASSAYVVSPIAGKIVAFYTVLQGAITTANAAVKLQIGGVDVTNGAVTVAYSGSAAGDVDSATPTAARTVTAGGAIEVESDGASSTAMGLAFTIVIDPNA